MDDKTYHQHTAYPLTSRLSALALRLVHRGIIIHRDTLGRGSP